MTDNNQFDKTTILKNNSNFNLWYDTIETALISQGLEKYITNDILKNLNEAAAKDEKAIASAKKENNKARLIILNTISKEIHQDIIGIESVYSIMKNLKVEYGESNEDIIHWMNKLHSLKANKISETIPKLKKMRVIFSYMKKSKLELSNREI